MWMYLVTGFVLRAILLLCQSAWQLRGVGGQCIFPPARIRYFRQLDIKQLRSENPNVPNRFIEIWCFESKIQISKTLMICFLDRNLEKKSLSIQTTNCQNAKVFGFWVVRRIFIIFSKTRCVYQLPKCKIWIFLRTKPMQ